MVTQASRVAWVLLSYRVPREPSTPRIAIWRQLKKLGVAQVSDGLVALPADARTVEAMEWVADDIIAAGGAATVWEARLASRVAEGDLIAGMVAARAVEYDALTARGEGVLAAAEAGLSTAEASRRLRLLRRELRHVHRRDFFPPQSRQRAQDAIKALADQLHERQSDSKEVGAR